MTRRALGRGRFLIVLGSIAALIGLLPTWWLVERTNLPPISGNGFSGVGIVIFLAALGMLAAVVLPFARETGESSLDRTATYLILAALAIGAFLFRLYQLSQAAGLGLPTSAPGLWITGAGLLVVAWGVADLLTERPPSY